MMVLKKRPIFPLLLHGGCGVGNCVEFESTVELKGVFLNVSASIACY